MMVDFLIDHELPFLVVLTKKDKLSMGSRLKKLMVTVFPGIELTLASCLRLKILLIRVDFPTLERPAKAISAHWEGGSWEDRP